MNFQQTFKFWEVHLTLEENVPLQHIIILRIIMEMNSVVVVLHAVGLDVQIHHLLLIVSKMFQIANGFILKILDTSKLFSILPPHVRDILDSN